jgi:hypothetical protein
VLFVPGYRIVIAIGCTAPDHDVLHWPAATCLCVLVGPFARCLLNNMHQELRQVLTYASQGQLLVVGGEGCGLAQ